MDDLVSTGSTLLAKRSKNKNNSGYITLHGELPMTHCTPSFLSLMLQFSKVPAAVNGQIQ